jgi:hypothetical protein
VRRALALLALAGAVILAGAVLIAATWHLPYPHALYCAIGNAATDGCDALPRTGAGQLAAVAVMLTAVPLLAAVFALATGAHVLHRWNRHHGRDLEQIRETAEKAHRIAADTHKALTGIDHPDAPPTTREQS